MDAESLETESEAARESRWTTAYAAGAAIGVIYGLLFRFYTSDSFGNHPNPLFHPAVSGTMTFSFLALGSFCIGMLSVYPAERAEARNPGLWLVLPGGPVFLACLLSILFRLEGAICMIFALPGALICAALGGIAGGLLARRRRVRNRTLACLVVLPFLLAPLETLI